VEDGFHTIDFSSLYYNPITTTTSSKAGCTPWVNPRLSLPAELTNVDPKWKSCQPLYYGAFDPPRILTKGAQNAPGSVQSASGPLISPVADAAQAQSTPASPAAMIVPNQAQQTSQPSDPQKQNVQPQGPVSDPTPSPPNQQNAVQNPPSGASDVAPNPLSPGPVGKQVNNAAVGQNQNTPAKIQEVAQPSPAPLYVDSNGAAGQGNNGNPTAATPPAANAPIAAAINNQNVPQASPAPLDVAPGGGLVENSAPGQPAAGNPAANPPTNKAIVPGSPPPQQGSSSGSTPLAVDSTGGIVQANAAGSPALPLPGNSQSPQNQPAAVYVNPSNGNLVKGSTPENKNSVQGNSPVQGNPPAQDNNPGAPAGVNAGSTQSNGQPLPPVVVNGLSVAVQKLPNGDINVGGNVLTPANPLKSANPSVANPGSIQNGGNPQGSNNGAGNAGTGTENSISGGQSPAAGSPVVIGGITYVPPAASEQTPVPLSVGSHPVQQASNGGLIVAGQTIPQGSQTSIDGHVVSVGTNSVVLDGSTHNFQPKALDSVQTPAPLLIGGQTAQKAPNGDLIIASQTIPIGVQTTISGTPISVGPSNLIIDGTAHPFSPSTPTPLTVGDLPIQKAPDGGILIGGTTLLPGAQTTISGTPISIDPSAIVIAGTPYALPTQTQTPLSIAGFPVQRAPNGGVIINGQTFTPGASTTIDNTPLSVGSTALVLAGSTLPFAPTTQPGSEVVIGSATIPLLSSIPSSQVYQTNGQTVTVPQSAFSAMQTTMIDGTPVIIETATVVSTGSGGAVVTATFSEAFVGSTNVSNVATGSGGGGSPALTPSGGAGPSTIGKASGGGALRSGGSWSFGSGGWIRMSGVCVGVVVGVMVM